MKNNLTRLQQQVEKETGLCIVRIQTEKELNMYLNKGLDALYRDVFGGPPYNEKFTLEEVRDIFRGFIREQGQVFVALDDEKDNKPVAFVTSVPLSAAFNVASAVKGSVRVKNAAYFAEDGVDANYRRKGISAQMKKLLLAACSVDGLEKVVLRTSANNYAQISAVNKAGGMVIRKTLQEVPRTLVDGKSVVDRNAFYLFNSDPKTSEVLNCVTVVRDAGGMDTAFVNDQSFAGKPKTMLGKWFDKSRKKTWARDISDTYPGVSAVAFNQSVPEGQKVFQGKMYFARYRASDVGCPR